MKILKIEHGEGMYYSFKQKEYFVINNIDRDALLEIVKYAIENDDVEIDECKEDEIKNQVQQIVYKEIYDKLKQLLKDKANIIDEINKEFDKAQKKYI